MSDLTNYISLENAARKMASESDNIAITVTMGNDIGVNRAAVIERRLEHWFPGATIEVEVERYLSDRRLSVYDKTTVECSGYYPHCELERLALECVFARLR